MYLSLIPSPGSALSLIRASSPPPPNPSTPARSPQNSSIRSSTRWSGVRPAHLRPPLRSGRRRGVALARCTKHAAAPARSCPTQRVHPHRRREGCGARRTDDQIAGLTKG
jgi:hypothetical protein